jgi:protein-L-isoaspartate(D-aspartate) O-methyltransferase
MWVAMMILAVGCGCAGFERKWLLGFVIALLSPFAGSAPSLAVSPGKYGPLRAEMVHAIEADVRFTSEALGKSALDAPVIRAMGKVPRHEFVPAAQRPYAYENRPLPIGLGQTISQPYIVAIMTDLLQLQPDDAVFELGTGSGYQAAVLAELAGTVYTMEIIEELGDRAGRTLRRLGYGNVEARVGDGYFGWPEHAPFDAIMVTAAGDHIPPPLIDQLKPGGRMMIPVGNRFFTQELLLVEKLPEGGIRTRSVLPVRFVPITGRH